ncbi:glycosyltransferase [bacterium]|nr:glycosyltransferase [bacterium]
MATLISLHYFATGPGQELYRYLRERGEEAALWEIPFSFSNRNFCRLTVFQGGHEWTFECPAPKGPSVWHYLRELRLTKKTLSLLEEKGFSVDTYIGNGAFDTLTGIRKKIAKTVNFTIDYAPKAQPWILRGVYRALDKYVCERAAAVWNLSPRMQEAREKDHPGLKCKKVRTVPHGTNFIRNAGIRKSPSNPQSLVFMGHLKEDSGADLVLRSMPELMKNFPDLTLLLAGSGPFEKALRDLSEELGLSERVKFTGFVESHDELEKMICSCAVGLALYNPEKEIFSRNADPGKPKVYLGCGLPVIITDVPMVAKEIEERGAGKIAAYDTASFAKALAEVLGNYGQFRKAAEEMGRDYDWSLIFQKALSDLWAK